MCAFDPEGLVFSVGVQSEHVKLYDLRGFDKGPFVTFKLPQEKQCEWTGKYSKNTVLPKYRTFALCDLMRIIAITIYFHKTGLRFSPNGKSILLTTNGSLMRLLDAFNGHPLQTFAGHLNNKGIPVDGCFSPDSKVLFKIRTAYTVVWALLISYGYISFPIHKYIIIFLVCYIWFY